VFTVEEAADHPSAATVEAALNVNFTFSPPVQVPSALLADTASYVLRVKLCNFLGACGYASAEVAVNKAASSLPVVAVSGQQQRTVSRNSPLLLYASASLATCNGTVRYSGLQRSWTVRDNSVWNSSIRSESADASVFRLSAYRLTPLHLYEVTFSALSTSSGVSSSTTVKVFVQQGQLRARIAGGSSVAVAIGGSIVLDGSSSRDDDVQGLTGTAAGLIFQWSCDQTAPAFSVQCALDFDRDGILGAIPSSQTAALFANERAVSTSSLVTLVVRDASGARSSSSSLTVRTQPVSAPQVAITTAVKDLTDVNPGSALTLSGTVSSQSSCVSQWSVDSVSLPAGSALTPWAAVVPAASSRPVNLVLAANALPARATVGFRLSCGPSTVRVEVTTNGPPLPGQFTVTPASGTALTTLFQFAAAF
jgi:hypothetical protein